MPAGAMRGLHPASASITSSAAAVRLRSDQLLRDTGDSFTGVMGGPIRDAVLMTAPGAAVLVISMPSETSIRALTGTLLLALAGGAPPAAAQEVATVTIDGTHALRRVDPRRAWGAALDGHDLGDLLPIYTAANVVAMRSAGLGPITYRLRTELGIETWHWNPAGTWSDPAHQEGYWISSSKLGAPITVSFGYRLPRRGRTIDDANNDGYSRIDDGDTLSFWKTDPYLDPRYTHDPDDQHPQWFSVDLGAPGAVQEIRLMWGDPYPRRYEVDYWEGDSTALIDDNPQGRWRRFPGGTVTDGHGGTADLRLAATPVRSRFVRVVLHASSHTASGGNGDPRDSLGFALREVLIGRDSAGTFHDLVRHDTTAWQQSVVLVSSTDPWHRAIDRDTSTAQPGLDMVLRSPLTNHLPVLVPTGLLFDTPGNAAAEVRYLHARHYPLAGVELGEEPDGQRITPEDYGALYTEFAAVIRRDDPTVKLGGPSWQNLLDDPLVLWPERASPGPHPTWIGRFLDYLDAHRSRVEFRFFTFEWYPFDNVCDEPWANLRAAPAMLTTSLDRLTAAGLPESIPRIISEYGYSSHLSPVEVTLPAALFDADLVGTFFEHGGDRAYYFGYEPGTLGHEPDCDQWGNLLMFLADSSGAVSDRLPRYHAMWLLTHAWADSSGGEHAVHRARVESADSDLDAFALLRPDHRWSLLLVNRDSSRERLIDPRVMDRSGVRAMRGPVDLWQYSAAQYRFTMPGPTARPEVDLPPAHHVVAHPTTFRLPPSSITVLTGW